jgi:peptidyl-tRNA hydrolase
MQWILGIGNPGQQYSRHYHNLGLIFANWLCETWPARQLEAKSDYELYELEYSNNDVEYKKFKLVKSKVFMKRFIGDA